MCVCVCVCVCSQKNHLCAQIISPNLSITLYCSTFYSQISKMPSVICFIHLHSEQRELTDERFMCFGGVMRPGNTQTNLHRVPYSPPCLSIFRSLPLLTLNISDCMWASEVIDTVVVYTLELWCKSDIQCLISKFCLFSWGEWKIYSEIRYTTRNYTSLEKQGENLHCLRKKSKIFTVVFQQLSTRTVHLKGQYP